MVERLKILGSRRKLTEMQQFFSQKKACTGKLVSERTSSLKVIPQPMLKEETELVKELTAT